MGRSRRKRSRSRPNPSLLFVRFFPAGQEAIGGVPLPMYGLLLRAKKDDKSQRVRDPSDPRPSEGIFFSKRGGCAQVGRLLRAGVIRPHQARYARRAIEASSLPKSDRVEVNAFRSHCSSNAPPQEIFEDDETLGLGTTQLGPNGPIPCDIAVIRAAGIAGSLQPTG